MALPPKADDPFFREVDEELRRAQLLDFWHRYGVTLVVALVLGLAAFAGGLWWKHDRIERAGHAAEQFTQALYDIDQGKAGAATPALTALEDSGIPAYRANARLTMAAAALEKGDVKAAVASYEAVAKDEKAPQAMRDAALIRQTVAEFDTLAPDAVVARLKPLAVEGAPWFGSAGELVALSYLKMNKPDLAGSLFAALARDGAVPPALRSRALRMAGSLGADTADTAASPKATAKE
ncbi:MAG TPA: tetratricopeptide repeat protein [Sphingomonadaceae bacterium]|nr:tetratricopeptide repeat protein [Sphingomonadaceae bacterium]